MTAKSLRMIDQNRLRFGMALTISLLVVAFILDSGLLVALVAVAQLLGAVGASFAPYGLLYDRVAKPSGLITPRPEPDNPEPHRFALLVGGIFNTVAVVALLTGVPVLAWVLVGVVVALANLNFWLHFCLGCWLYYQLNRLGVPGFGVAPLGRES